MIISWLSYAARDSSETFLLGKLVGHPHKFYYTQDGCRDLIIKCHVFVGGMGEVVINLHLGLCKGGSLSPVPYGRGGSFVFYRPISMLWPTFPYTYTCVPNQFFSVASFSVVKEFISGLPRGNPVSGGMDGSTLRTQSFLFC